MRFIDIALTMFSINLVLALFAQVGLGGNNFEVQSIEVISPTGESLDPNSMSYKVRQFSANPDNIYNNAGAADPNQVYLQSGGDFLRGLLWFVDIFKNSTVGVGSTLRNFGIPAEIVWFFATPVYIVYFIAIAQLVSGRAFEGMM